MQESGNQKLGVEAGTGAATGAGLDGGSTRGTGGGTNAGTDSQGNQAGKSGHPLVKVEPANTVNNEEQNQDVNKQQNLSPGGTNAGNVAANNDSYGEGSGRSFGYESVGGSEVSDLVGEVGANTGFTKVDSSDANRRVENAEQSKESRERRNG